MVLQVLKVREVIKVTKVNLAHRDRLVIRLSAKRNPLQRNLSKRLLEALCSFAGAVASALLTERPFWFTKAR